MEAQLVSGQAGAAGSGDNDAHLHDILQPLARVAYALPPRRQWASPCREVEAGRTGARVSEQVSGDEIRDRLTSPRGFPAEGLSRSCARSAA